MSDTLRLPAENREGDSGRFPCHTTGWREHLRGAELKPVTYAADTHVDITQLRANTSEPCRSWESLDLVAQSLGGAFSRCHYALVLAVSYKQTGGPMDRPDNPTRPHIHDTRRHETV